MTENPSTKTLEPGEYARLEDIPADQMLSAGIYHTTTIGDPCAGVRSTIFIYARGVDMEYLVPRYLPDGILEPNPEFDEAAWRAALHRHRVQNAFYFDGLTVSDAVEKIRASGWRGAIEVKKAEEINSELPALEDELEPAEELAAETFSEW